MSRASRRSLLPALYTLHVYFSLRIVPSTLCLSVSKSRNVTSLASVRHRPSQRGTKTRKKEKRRQRQDLASPPSPSIRQQSGGLLVPFRPLLRANAAVSTFSLPPCQALHHTFWRLVMASMPNSVGENVTDKGGSRLQGTGRWMGKRPHPPLDDRHGRNRVDGLGN